MGLADGGIKSGFDTETFQSSNQTQTHRRQSGGGTRSGNKKAVLHRLISLSVYSSGMKNANLLPQSVPLFSNAGRDNKAPLSRPAGTGDHKMRLNLRRYNLSGQVIRSGLARKHRGQSPTLHAWRSPPQAQNRRA